MHKIFIPKRSVWQVGSLIHVPKLTKRSNRKIQSIPSKDDWQRWVLPFNLKNRSEVRVDFVGTDSSFSRSQLTGMAVAPQS
jgi:hypothetical protein